MFLSPQISALRDAPIPRSSRCDRGAPRKTQLFLEDCDAYHDSKYDAGLSKCRDECERKRQCPDHDPRRSITHDPCNAGHSACVGRFVLYAPLSNRPASKLKTCSQRAREPVSRKG